jgi:hypothetical protein
MVATYDKGVKNLIAGLNATKHVTHTKHRKTKITVHHNAGRLSHEGVLEVWKTRPASAHFDSDAYGAIAQYVEMNEYAWSTGSTNGNRESISIELCNSAIGGDWPVSDVTWRSGARLAGWICAKVIGERPSNSNIVVPHSFWKATACPGPYMTRLLPEFIRVAQQAYDFFQGGGSSPPPPPAPGGKSLSQLADEVIAGHWGNNPQRAHALRAAGHDPAAVQAEVNRKLGGNVGGVPAPPARKTNTQLADEVLAGHWGNGEDRERRLTQAGYHYAAIQAEVNRRLGGGAPAAHRPNIAEVARQVIRGEWGNGVTRRQRLEGAGYNYASVQAEVNRQLK